MRVKKQKYDRLFNLGIELAEKLQYYNEYGFIRQSNPFASPDDRETTA